MESEIEMNLNQDFALSQELAVRLVVARRAARAAGDICNRIRASFSQQDLAHKVGREPVTVADYVSQAIITWHLRREFPEDRLIAEEAGSALRDGEHGELVPAVERRFSEAMDAVGSGETLKAEEILDLLDNRGGSGSITWVVDPIDGTKGYLRGDQYAVAVGLLYAGQPVAGVLGCPAWPGGAAVFFGQQGKGSWRETAVAPEPIAVSASSRSAELRILASVESSHGDPVVVRGVREALGIAKTVRVDSQAKYGYVATGGAEIYLRPQSTPGYQEKVWDHVAGVAVVEAAGGTVTDIDGKPLDFSRGSTLDDNRGVLATHGRLHSQVVEAIRQVEQDAR